MWFKRKSWYFFLFSEIGKVRGNLFQINGKKNEPLVLPDAVGTSTSLSEKVYVPIKEYPDVSLNTTQQISLGWLLLIKLGKAELFHSWPVKNITFERFSTNVVLHHHLDPQRDHMRVVTTFCTWLPYNKIFKNAIFTMDFAVDSP